MQSAINVPSTLREYTAFNQCRTSRGVLELHRAETIPSASQVQAIYKQVPQNSFRKVTVYSR